MSRSAAKILKGSHSKAGFILDCWSYAAGTVCSPPQCSTLWPHVHLPENVAAMAQWVEGGHLRIGGGSVVLTALYAASVLLGRKLNHKCVGDWFPNFQIK